MKDPHGDRLLAALGGIEYRYGISANADLDRDIELFRVEGIARCRGLDPSFRVHKGLALRLLATSVEGLRPCDVHLPYLKFEVVLDEWVMHRPCNFHVARADVEEVPLRLSNAVVSLWGEKAIEIRDTDHGCLTFLRQDARLRDQELSEEQSIFAQFIMNLCLYIESTPTSLRLAAQPDIDRLSSGPLAKRKSTKERIARLKQTQVFDVGTDVVIDPRLEEALFGASPRRSWKLSYRTLVRGHWREQVHGEGRLQRKRLWIEPHIRGSEGPVVSHNYSFPEEAP